VVVAELDLKFLPSAAPLQLDGAPRPENNCGDGQFLCAEPVENLQRKVLRPSLQWQPAVGVPVCAKPPQRLKFLRCFGHPDGSVAAQVDHIAQGCNGGVQNWDIGQQVLLCTRRGPAVATVRSEAEFLEFIHYLVLPHTSWADGPVSSANPRTIHS